MPVYNRAERVGQAIQSIIDQTFEDWELIVVDDYSTDNTWEVIQTFQSAKIRVLRNDHNLERCLSRNRGIEASTGEYIAFLDSDDHHLPEHYEELNKFILGTERPKAFFFTNAFNESENGFRSNRICPSFEKYDPYVYFLRYTVNPQRWAVHRDVMMNNLFDPEINICEDMDVSLRIVNSGSPVYQLKKRTTCYVAASDSFTYGDSRKWERELDALEKIFARPEIEPKLPKKEKLRLKSMCHYHLAAKEFERGKFQTFWPHALTSFWQFPGSYNGKTNYPLFVMMVYSIPGVGPFLRKMRSLVKSN